MKKPNPLSKDVRTAKLKKDMTAPSPGDYDVEKSFSKTHAAGFNYKIASGKIRSFVEDYKKAKSFLPGIGSYEITSKAYDRLTRSPPLHKTLRH
jgi:hypothetical protein